MRSRRVVTVCSAVAIGVVVLAGPAAADPKVQEGETVTLDCGAGPMPIALSGNGRWTPAHVLDGKTVYQPVAFGESSGSFEVLTGPNAGETGVPPQDDPVAKKGARVGQGAQECRYHVEGTFYEPNFDGLLHFVSEGTVIMKVTHS